VREGAVVPVKVQRAYTGLGDEASAEYMTWLIYPKGTNEFTLFHPESHPKPERTTVKVESGESLKIQFSGKHEPHILRIFTHQKPSAVTLDGKQLPEVSAADGAWTYDTEHDRLIIKTRDYADGNYLISWR
jgi:alpha-D-xyloside xylohydrolase